MSDLGILWRGPLDSCNYGCSYCPFAKRAPNQDVMAADRAALARFVDWVELQNQWTVDVLFTPWGEALIQPWYRDALIRLSRAPGLRSVAIQTNGSAPMGFLDRADRTRIALWISWHPTEIERGAFVDMVRALHASGTRLSVGAVAVPAHAEEIEALRRQLPLAVPMWLNAQRPGPEYDEAAVARWSDIDPHFSLEVRPHRTRGRACRTGETVISVNGSGDIQRCHFVDEVIGNLYADDLARVLAPRPCPRARCDCWIGYSHLRDLAVRESYDERDFFARIRRAPSG